MDKNIWHLTGDYFITNMDSVLIAVKEHIVVSFIALFLAVIIGISSGYFAVKYNTFNRQIVSIFQVLRVIPSLAVLLLLIPIMGTGVPSAIIALIFLAIPPILMNTAAALKEVPSFMLESAYGMGMTERQVLWKVQFPLAMPLIFTGIKTAMIEVIASATLAAKIGAGGVGEIIFTGLGLNRVDLLLVGGITVGLLTVIAALLLELVKRIVLRYKYVS